MLLEVESYRNTDYALQQARIIYTLDAKTQSQAKMHYRRGLGDAAPLTSESPSGLGAAASQALVWT